MGIVSQEPVLFATSIGENIKLGAKWGVDVTDAQVEEAAKQANCYDFINRLPKVCMVWQNFVLESNCPVSVEGQLLGRGVVYLQLI